MAYCDPAGGDVSVALPMTNALTPLATRFGVDLTPLREREQAYADMLSAALARDDAAWAEARARFHAKGEVK